MKILIAYPNLPMMITPALSVGIFTAICDRNNVDVEFFETTPYTSDDQQGMVFKSKLGGGRAWEHGTTLKHESEMLPDFVALTEKFEPDLVLFSVAEDCLTDTENMLKSIAHLNIPHIVGGVLPINDPEFVLQSPWIDTIATYEGELLLQDVIDNWPFYDLCKGLNGNPRQPLADLNDITPDYRLYNSERFYRPMGGKVVKSIPVETYRGCPYNCTFCNSPTTRMMDKGYLRQKSLEQVRKELDTYVETLQPDHWFFVDDSFTARPKQDLIDLCNLIGEYKIPWWCNTRIEAVDPEILQVMKDSYCDRIQFGIECGNEQYRIKTLKRNIKNSTYYDKIKDINECGIPYGLNVIIGLPHETESMVFETVDLVKKFAGYDGIGVSIFIPYRGTQLREYAIQHGLLDPDWTSSNGYLLDGSPLKMPEPYLQNDRIWDLANKFKYFCFFDKDRWTEIESGANLEEEYNEKFYAKYAMSGIENIQRRNAYACSVDACMEF